ncbi:MAG: methyltransferase domain-containing protein [Verrucomicrobia bacterium]|nr:methyltransferase domain-containing protein [Verrucomicrobiota bacterium]
MQPAPGDHHYLVLSDLRNYLGRFRTDTDIRLLDYGSGPSPYRSLFPNSDYRRADYVPSPGLAYVVDDDSRVPERDGLFDLVLSTQVAEHVANPACYFREALRLLRPGGRFVVTTHGVWPDHGTPYDFQRWTAAGLARDVAHAGFVNLRSAKLTAGFRAYAFLTLDALSMLGGGRTRLRRLAGSALQKALRFARPSLHRRIDSRWPKLRITDLDDPNSGPSFYILLALEARRPSA